MDSSQEKKKGIGKYSAIGAFAVLVFALVAFGGVFYLINYPLPDESSKLVSPVKPTESVPTGNQNLNISARSVALNEKIEAENRFSAKPDTLVLNTNFQDGVLSLIDGDVFAEQGKHAAADKKYMQASASFKKTAFGEKTITTFFNGARPLVDPDDFPPVYNKSQIRFTIVDKNEASIRDRVEEEYAKIHGLQIALAPETSMSPSTVFVGGNIDIYMQYVILGAGAGVEVKEVQVITREGKEILEVSNREKKRKDSTWTSNRTFKLPEDFGPGNYELKQMLVVNSNKYTRTSSFTVSDSVIP